MPSSALAATDHSVLSMREVKLVALFRRFNERTQLGLVRKLEHHVENPYPSVGIAEHTTRRGDAIDRVVDMLPELSDGCLTTLTHLISEWLKGASSQDGPSFHVPRLEGA